jgi:hypothetical protein
MPYILTRSDGSTLATIQDGSLDKSTDLVFVGRNYAGYGQVVNENLVKLLENFANTSPPKSPLKGELWFDTLNKKLKIFNGSVYQTLAFVNSTSITKPADQTKGDLFWDQQDQKLYVYNGIEHVLIGPPFSQNLPNTNWGASSINGYPIDGTDIQTTPHTVLKASVNGSISAVLSYDDPYTVRPGELDTFDYIFPGFNLPNTVVDNSTIQGGFPRETIKTLIEKYPGTNGFWGLGTASLGMAYLTGYDNTDSTKPIYVYKSANEFLTSDDLVGTGGTKNLKYIHLIDSSSEISIGAGGLTARLQVTGPRADLSSSGVVALSNILPASSSSTPRIEFNVTPASGVLTNVMAVDGGNSTITALAVLPGQDNIVSLGNTYNNWSNVWSTLVTTKGLSTPSSITTGTITGHWKLGPNSSIEIGGGAVSASTANVATNANYLQSADLMTYIHTSLDGSNNSIPQTDNSGFIMVGGINAVNAGSSVSGDWTVNTGGTFQATSLKGTGSAGYISADTAATNNTIAQRGTDGSLKATTLYGTTAQVQNLNAGVTTSAIGHITGQWQLLSGSTLQATYSDIAERYEADQPYEPGTVLIVGGEKELTVTSLHADVRVAGIISTAPAFKLNAEAGDDDTHPYIALKGRVPCKVTGWVKKGSRLVTSLKPGYAESFREGDDSNAVVGIALESKETVGDGIIEVLVK